MGDYLSYGLGTGSGRGDGTNDLYMFSCGSGNGYGYSCGIDETQDIADGNLFGNINGNTFSNKLDNPSSQFNRLNIQSVNHLINDIAKNNNGPYIIYVIKQLRIMKEKSLKQQEYTIASLIRNAISDIVFLHSTIK